MNGTAESERKISQGHAQHFHENWQFAELTDGPVLICKIAMHSLPDQLP
jgi:hypothetical protein